MNIKALREQRGQYVSQARGILNTAQQQRRDLTDDEAKQFDQLHAKSRTIKAQIEQTDVEVESSQLQRMPANLFGVDGLSGSSTGNSPQGGLAAAIANAGWDVRKNPQVELPVGQVFQNAYPGEDDLNPRRLPGIHPFGRDQRFLWPQLQVTTLGMHETSIHDFRQNSRSLSGTVERDISATTDKAVLDPGVEFVETPLRLFAIILENLPQVLFDSMNGAQQFFNGAANFRLNAALDTHVLTTLLADGENTNAALTDIVEDTRSAVSAMQSDGRNPDLIAVTPQQAEDLDLFKQPSGDDYLFVPDTTEQQTLWRLRVVTVSDDTTLSTGPILIDSRSLGNVYFGHSVRFLADPYSGLKQNTVRLRYEFTALMHVRSPDAALRIGTSGGSS